MQCWRGVLVQTTLILTQPTYLALRYFVNPNYFSLTHTFWLASAATTWIYIVTQISIPFFTSPLHRLPSPPGDRFPIGHLDFNKGQPPTENIARMVENTPNDGLLVLWAPLYLFGQVIPTRPDTLMELLNTHNYDWEKPAGPKRFLARTLGEGLVNAEGDQHKAMRKAVAPAFSGHHIRELVPLFYTKGLAFADYMAREAANGPVEITSAMSRVTLDIIGAAGVGMDFNTIKNDDNPLAKLYAIITDRNRGPFWLFLFLNQVTPPWFVRQLRGTSYARVANAQKQLRIDARHLIQEKKRLVLDTKEQQKDIIAIIMRSGDFSDDYLVDQLLTFLAAGHDTTASAMTWATWLLSLHPQIQDRLRAECNHHLADKPIAEITASDFDVETMPYLTAVCNETLRFYPTIAATSRNAAKETKIGTQVIPKGTSALISPWAINRSHALWGTDADEYNPDRWLNRPNAVYGGAKSPNALLTFLHGPRSCIGQTFARTEMKCLLATLVMRFTFGIADPDEKVEIAGIVSIKPLGGLRLRLRDLNADTDANGKADVQA